MPVSELMQVKEKYAIEMRIRSQIPDELYDLLRTQTVRNEKKYKEHYKNSIEGSYTKDDWLKLDFVHLWIVLNYSEQKHIIRNTLNVLELGSGNGSSSMMWAYKGYNIIGIEIDPLLVDLTEKNYVLFKQEFPDKPTPRVFQGNYFPKEYINNKEYEKIAPEITNLHNLISFKPEKLVLETRNDVYKENNINIKDIDIFFGYFWASQIPATVDMFKKHARKDALFMPFGPCAEQISTNMNLKQLDESQYVYYK